MKPIYSPGHFAWLYVHGRTCYTLHVARCTRAAIHCFPKLISTNSLACYISLRYAVCGITRSRRPVRSSAVETSDGNQDIDPPELVLTQSSAPSPHFQNRIIGHETGGFDPLSAWQAAPIAVTYASHLHFKKISRIGVVHIQGVCNPLR